MPKLSEEKITLSIVKWLKIRGWTILAFDFPQSGKGVVLHPNGLVSKNYETIIPDIAAIKGGTGILMENKDRYFPPDIEKLRLIRTGRYSTSITKLFGEKVTLYLGLGLPDNKVELEKAKKKTEDLEFLISVDEEGSLKVEENIPRIDF